MMSPEVASTSSVRQRAGPLLPLSLSPPAARARRAARLGQCVASHARAPEPCPSSPLSPPRPRRLPRTPQTRSPPSNGRQRRCSGGRSPCPWCTSPLLLKPPPGPSLRLPPSLSLSPVRSPGQPVPPLVTSNHLHGRSFAVGLRLNSRPPLLLLPSRPHQSTSTITAGPSRASPSPPRGRAVEFHHHRRPCTPRPMMRSPLATPAIVAHVGGCGSLPENAGVLGADGGGRCHRGERRRCSASPPLFPVAPRGRLKATCRRAPRVIDQVGWPDRLSGNGFGQIRLPRAKAHRREAAFNGSSSARTEQPPGPAQLLFRAQCAQLPPQIQPIWLTK
nr:proline-rich protein 36-like [Aegilops tauschii subsp. strangulata]